MVALLARAPRLSTPASTPSSVGPSFSDLLSSAYGGAKAAGPKRYPVSSDLLERSELSGGGAREAPVEPLAGRVCGVGKYNTRAVEKVLAPGPVPLDPTPWLRVG